MWRGGIASKENAMSGRTSRILLGVVFLVGLIAVFTIPKVLHEHIGQIAQVTFFGLVTLDWVWLRLLKPGLKRGSEQASDQT